MNVAPEMESINCPYCRRNRTTPWATEHGYTMVRCSTCGLLYVNPRPTRRWINEAVATGIHRDIQCGGTAIGSRSRSKIGFYKSILSSMFVDVWGGGSPISWLDVGAGYGEFVESLNLMPFVSGSTIEGVEPMKPKADHARSRGLSIRDGYLREVDGVYDFLSLINVFSHIPDFREFLCDVKRVLKPTGEFFIETGNIGDLQGPWEVPTELDLPDHLVFASEQRILDYLQEADFIIVAIERRRKDGLINLGKNVIKAALGRPVTWGMPYTSNYRRIFVRARRRA